MNISLYYAVGNFSAPHIIFKRESLKYMSRLGILLKYKMLNLYSCWAKMHKNHGYNLKGFPVRFRYDYSVHTDLIKWTKTSCRSSWKEDTFILATVVHKRHYETFIVIQYYKAVL